ncbi:MAG: hypothetical protein RI952_611 [Bacteroidota bacterium]|jgi:hypothetical protein
MKFINYLTSIAGVSIFPLLSLMIFVTFFAVLIVYLIKSDKASMEKMGNIPLEKNDDQLNFSKYE